MRFADAVISALDALRLHKLRSALTMLGIIIGVASGDCDGGDRGPRAQAGGGADPHPGANLLVVMPGNVTQLGVQLGTCTASSLTDEDAAAAMREVASVQVAAPFVQANAQLVAAA